MKPIIIQKSKYKYVSFVKVPIEGGMEQKWIGKISKKGILWTKFFATEKEAAIGVDMMLIKRGKEPVNILTRKYTILSQIKVNNPEQNRQ